jgi:predicted nucleotide-binding protein (sugar kinase/HSP70/actin superfamily)
MLCKHRERDGGEERGERERECVKKGRNLRRKGAESRNAVRTYSRRRCSDRRAIKEERTEMLKIQIADRGVALTTHPYRATRLQKRWNCTSSPP